MVSSSLKGLEEKGFALEQSDGKLGLRDLQAPKTSPLEVDFLAAPMRYRLAHGLSKNQPMAKAIGLKSRKPEHAPFIFDATAGLGVDAFFLAALGCRVRSVERSPVIFALLEDGYRRLGEEAALAELHARLSFEAGEAVALLQSLGKAERPDVVYLDPMYPEEGHSASALPKKAMQMFRRLLEDEGDSGREASLLEAALRSAKARVVVKRPLTGVYLGERKPSHAFKGKTARFDLYLV